MIRRFFKYLLRADPPIPRQSINGLLEWSLISQVVRKYAVNCVIDVGANKGQFAKTLRQVGYSGWICSFEPIPADFAELSHAFRHDPRWRGFNLALGSQSDTLPLHIPEESSAMSSFLNPVDAGWKVRSHLVKVQRLDALFSQAVAGIEQPRVFLKIDTQGFDMEVVKGATQCLDWVVCLQSELSVTPVYHGMPHYLDALAYYEHLGFRLVGLAEILRSEQTQTIDEINCLMNRPERT